jgi:tetratricopeptide (TPR) repeat protein
LYCQSKHDEIDEALELFKSVLSSHRDKYGDIHHLVGTANHNIGLIYLFAQQYAQAMAFFQEAVTVREAALGSEHPAVAASLMKIGMIFLLRRDPETAKNTFFRVLKLVRKSLGHGHIQVARVLNNIAVAQYDQGAYLDVFRTFQEAHEIQRRLLLLSQSESSLLNQKKTIELALSYTLGNIAFLYCRQKKYKDSLRMLQEADKLRREHVGIFQPDIGCVDENLRYVRALVGDIERKELIEQNDAVDNFFEMLYATTMGRINSPLRC